MFDPLWKPQQFCARSKLRGILDLKKTKKQEKILRVGRNQCRQNIRPDFGQIGKINERPRRLGHFEKIKNNL
jgi:hypothetical protein